MKNHLLSSIFLSVVFVGCSSTSKHQQQSHDPKSAAQARKLALTTRIDSLKALTVRTDSDNQRLDSLRSLLAAEQANLDLMNQAQSYTPPSTSAQELYEENQKAAAEDRSLGRKPSPTL